MANQKKQKSVRVRVEIGIVWEGQVGLDGYPHVVEPTPQKIADAEAQIFKSLGEEYVLRILEACNNVSCRIAVSDGAEEGTVASILDLGERV